MKRLLSICLVLLLIGSASALPLWGPAQGFRNPGDVELGSLTIDGVSIDGGDVSYDEFVAGMVTNETAINSSIAALLLAAYTNETAINSSAAALTLAAYTNETAINTSLAALTLAAYTNETAINSSLTALTIAAYTNETAINTSIAAQAVSQVINETAINSSIDTLTLGAYTNETAINTSIAALTVPLVSFPYTADVVDQAVFTASGGWVLTSVVLTPTVAGTGEGAATVMVKLCDSAEAPASGDAMLNSTLDLEGTIHTPQAGALTTYTGVSIPDGKIVALDFTGTLTSSVGSITLYGKRA